jgi:hypothetical protein
MGSWNRGLGESDEVGFSSQTRYPKRPDFGLKAGQKRLKKAKKGLKTGIFDARGQIIFRSNHFIMFKI